MRYSVPTALAACCASAQAFSDSTSFVLFSTAKYATSTSSRLVRAYALRTLPALVDVHRFWSASVTRKNNANS